MKFPNRPTPKHWLLMAVLCLALLAGCGQKGPLYLPESVPPATKTEPGPAPADAEAEPRGDDDESP